MKDRGSQIGTASRTTVIRANVRLQILIYNQPQTVTYFHSN